MLHYIWVPNAASDELCGEENLSQFHEWNLQHVFPKENFSWPKDEEHWKKKLCAANTLGLHYMYQPSAEHVQL